MKSQQKVSKQSVKASDLTVSRIRFRRISSADKEPIKEIIRYVNLVPPDFDWDRGLPPEKEEEIGPLDEVKSSLLAWISTLPGPLRVHLLEHMQRPDEWQMFPMFGAVVSELASPQLFDFRSLLNVVPRYKQIQQWHENLRYIAQRGAVIRVDSVGEIDWQTGTIRYLREPLGDALDRIDVRFIRECAHCKRIHYADQIYYNDEPIQPRCGSKCAHLLRQARYEPKKETYRLNRKIRDVEKDRQEKRATKARKR